MSINPANHPLYKYGVIIDWQAHIQQANGDYVIIDGPDSRSAEAFVAQAKAEGKTAYLVECRTEMWFGEDEEAIRNSDGTITVAKVTPEK